MNAVGVGHADGIDGDVDRANRGADVTGAVANNTLVQVTTNTLKVRNEDDDNKLAATMNLGTFSFKEQKVVGNNFTTAANSALQGAIALAGQNNAN